MKTTGTMRVPTRRRFPLTPVVVAAVVAVTATVAGLAWGPATRLREAASGTPRVEARATSEDPALVLRSHMADALRYRTALARADAAGTAVLGLRVLREARRQAVVARVLRYFPELTAREVARMGFGDG